MEERRENKRLRLIVEKAIMKEGLCRERIGQ